MASIRVRIGTIAVPGGRGAFDPEDLRRRVEAELAALLVREPLHSMPLAGARIQAPGGRLHAASAATPASIARVVARRIHSGMQTGEART